MNFFTEMNHRKRLISFALPIFLSIAVGFVLAAFASPPAFGQATTIHWGGTISAGGEAFFYEEETHIDAMGALRLQARTLTYPWRVFFDGRLRATGPMNTDGSWETKSDVDRLYLRLYLPSADITLGRQFVNWGVGYAWSPTDVFNPPDPTDPQGLRKGIDAAVAQIPVGPLDYWTIALAEKRYGVRRRGNISGTDWSVAAISDAGDTVIGADLKGDLGVGWHVAFAHRISDAPSAKSTSTLLLGTDYSWLSGDLFWVGEVLIQPNPISGETESHTFQQLTYRWDDFTSISGSVLAPLQSGVRWWNASYHTVLSAQSELTVALTLLDGDFGPGLPAERARLKAEYAYAF